MSVICDVRKLGLGKKSSFSQILPTLPGLADELGYDYSREGVKEDHTASYFSHSNQSATQTRDSIAEESLEMLIDWLKKGGNVGIHGEDTAHETSSFSPIRSPIFEDATNSTRTRR